MQTVHRNHSGCVWETSEPFRRDVIFGDNSLSIHSASYNQLSNGSGPCSMHSIHTSIHTPSVMLYSQRQPYYLSLLCFPADWFCRFFFPHHAWLRPSCLKERSEWSSHQTEHGDLPLAISASGANWRWFSITALTRGNRRIRAILSIWQAVIREAIWRSPCFKWIIAWFTLPAWRAFVPAWTWGGYGGACVKCILIGVLCSEGCLLLKFNWVWTEWNLDTSQGNSGNLLLSHPANLKIKAILLSFFRQRQDQVIVQYSRVIEYAIWTNIYDSDLGSLSPDVLQIGYHTTFFIPLECKMVNEVWTVHFLWYTSIRLFILVHYQFFCFHLAGIHC